MEDNKLGICSTKRAEQLGSAARVAGGYVALDSVESIALQVLLGNADADDRTARYLVAPTDFGDLGTVDKSDAIAAIKSSPNVHQPELKRLLELIER